MERTTLVVYCGTEHPWDGAKCLHELLEIDGELKEYVTNYKLNLYDCYDHDTFDERRTSRNRKNHQCPTTGRKLRCRADLFDFDLQKRNLDILLKIYGWQSFLLEKPPIPLSRQDRQFFHAIIPYQFWPGRYSNPRNHPLHAPSANTPT